MKQNESANSLSEKLRTGNLFAEKCPSREVLKHLTSRWGVLIMVALRDGTHRFSELRRKMGGVSEKMLAQSLQWLEADGFVLRRARPVVPPHVEYSLTPLGWEVSEKVAALADWIEDNLPRVQEVSRAEERGTGEARQSVTAVADSTAR
ncbi:winged helix-turn-helix transcriptional regulator [Enterobacteriaceae bacterium BIT-l23]|uniref:winged helix-turn-helix transcriptional regulator n=1 Tax=Jejubacter sp. L23 TaxID=3092086 RepID=UPI001584ED49|nr:winged helix-turn-helix transcriptional regulator [Enterobacteriaceae bacterium BIT-l23]